MSNRYIFSSESVGEGHPDKVADTISDAVLDACLSQDKFSRVACETYVKSNIAIIGGEITTKAKLDFVKIARDAIREIGYVNDDDVFHADKVFVNVIVTQQSPDIAQGVDAKKAKGKKTTTAAGPKVRKPRTQDPAIATILAENKAKLEALKAEGKVATAKVRADLASNKRLQRELHRLSKWPQEDRDRLLAVLPTIATPPLALLPTE